MGQTPNTVRTVKALRKHVAAWRKAGETIALVPTMGALHEGHLSLVRLAMEKADRAVVSIFVNPKQFAPHEDFGTYPRDEAGDMARLAALGVDLVFAPDGAEIYPDDFSTSVAVSGLTEALCGVSRPHFFGGVATVVCKLLLQCLPDIAVFGEKDYQQLLVVRRMARDLDIPVAIVGGAIVREEDGLALSSRNAYLSAAERKTAPALYRTISGVARALAGGATVAEAVKKGRKDLKAAGFEVDYLEVRNAETLAAIGGKVKEPARVFAAAFLGRTRLIDNVAVPRT